MQYCKKSLPEITQCYKYEKSWIKNARWSCFTIIGPKALLELDKIKKTLIVALEMTIFFGFWLTVHYTFFLLSLQLSRMQNNLHDPDESMAVTSVSYPNSAANQSGINFWKHLFTYFWWKNGFTIFLGIGIFKYFLALCAGVPQEMASGAGGGRQSWSAPQNGDPFGFNGPNSIMPGSPQRLKSTFFKTISNRTVLKERRKNFKKRWF